jgi:CheY-like chemotaxis protein
LQARVFESFYQLDSSDVREHQGAGLGLAISRQIVENLGGEIGLYSEPGHGATFGVTLDFGAAAQEAADEDDEAMRTGQRLSLRLNEAGVRRVLVAEDNAFNRLIITNMLETLPLEVEEVEDGEAALSRWRDGSFDVILLDCHLPYLSGFEVAAKIRNEEAARGNGRTHIIAVTAYALAGDRERCLAAGIDEYLPKPFTAAQLRKALTRRAAAL